jgi:SLT domain-containing protein
MNFLGAAINKVNGLFTFMREEMGWLATIARVVAAAYAFTFGAKAVAGMVTFYGWLKKINVLEKINLGIDKARAAARAVNIGMTGIGLATVAAGLAAGIGVYAALGGLDSHAAGTDSTSGRMALVGEEGPEGLVSPDGRKGGIVGANGPEFIHPPKGSAVINNTTMTTLASQATSRSVAGQVAGQSSNAAMAASIASLKGAMKEMSNRPIEVTTNPVMLKDTLGGGVNDHFGEPGTRPIRLRTT